jgi:hypothetical protein
MGRLKYFFIILGILVLLILLIVVALLFLGKDEGPPNDEDLLLPKIEIKEKENGYYYYDQFQQKIYYPPETDWELINNILDGKEWDAEYVEELVEKNAEAFYYFDKMTQTSRYHNPYLLDPDNVSVFTPLIHYSGLQSIARFSMFKAELLFRNGKEKEAFDECFKVIKMGHMLEEGRNNLIGYLVGEAINKIGLKQLARLTARTTLSPEVLKTYADQLDNLYSKKEGWINVMKLQYIELVNTNKETIDIIAEHGDLGDVLSGRIPLLEWLTLGSDYLYKPNQTRRMLAEYFRNEINAVNENYYIKTKDYELLNYFNLDSLWKILTTENSVGKSLYNNVAISYSGLLNAKYLEDFLGGGTQLLIALRAYYLDYGKFPDSLNQLVPNYISEIPKDPFDGELIRYDSNKKVIYSAGKDSISSDIIKGDDFIIEIKF